MKERAEGFWRAPFVLSEASKVRAKLLKLGDAESVLLFVMHHVASDGWSMGVLVRELTELYAAHVEGRALALAPLPVQYADYAEWQRGWLRDEVLERQLAYFRSALEGAPPVLELPTDRPRPKMKGDQGGEVKLALSPELGQKVSALAHERGGDAVHGAPGGVRRAARQVRAGARTW